MSLEPFPRETVRRIFHKARFGQDKFILVQKYRIHYVDTGKGEPIILVPGSFSTYRMWNRLMPSLIGDYRVIAPDYGLSLGSVEAETDLIALMVQQMNLGKVNLVGGAYGGAIVFDLAARYPELVNKIVSIQGGAITAEAVAKAPPRKSWINLSLSRQKPNSLEDRAKGIQVPILYLFGTKSEDKSLLARNMEYLKKFLPQTWIVALEGGIHELSMHKPREITDIILMFLRTNLEKSQ